MNAFQLASFSKTYGRPVVFWAGLCAGAGVDVQAVGSSLCIAKEDAARIEQIYAKANLPLMARAKKEAIAAVA